MGLFNRHHLPEHWIVQELGVVLVRLALRRFVEEISGENAVFFREVMISAYREEILVRDLEGLKSKLPRIASRRNRLIRQRNEVGIQKFRDIRIYGQLALA